MFRTCTAALVQAACMSDSACLGLGTVPSSTSSRTPSCRTRPSPVAAAAEPWVPRGLRRRRQRRRGRRRWRKACGHGPSAGLTLPFPSSPLLLLERAPGETTRDLPRAAGDRPSEAIEREAGILWRLRHRDVVWLHEILVTRKKVHFALDLAAGGELFSPVLRDLLRRVLGPDPSARIDADGIVAHQWFRHGASDEELGRLMHGVGGGGVQGGGQGAGRKGGYHKWKDGKKAGGGPVYVEDEEGDGGVVAKVRVFRLADVVSGVEVVKGDGVDAALFWSDLLEPAMKPPALS